MVPSATRSRRSGLNCTPQLCRRTPPRRSAFVDKNVAQPGSEGVRLARLAALAVERVALSSTPVEYVSSERGDRGANAW
jgi:hypothetical protein